MFAVGYTALIALVFGGMWFALREIEPELTYREIAAGNREHWEDWLKPGVEVDPSTQTYTLSDGNVIALKWRGNFEPGDRWRFYRPNPSSAEIVASDAEGLELAKLKNEAPEPAFPGIMFHLQQLNSKGTFQIARAKLFDELSLADLGVHYGWDYNGRKRDFDWFRPADFYTPVGMGAKTFVFPTPLYGGAMRLVVDIVHGPERRSKALFVEKEAICKIPEMEIKVSEASKIKGKDGKEQILYFVKTHTGLPLELGLPAEGRPFTARLLYPKNPTVLFESIVREGSYFLPVDMPVQPATEINLTFADKVTRLIFRIPAPTRGPAVTLDSNVFDLPTEQLRFESSSAAISFMASAAHLDFDLGGQPGSSIEGETLGQLYKNWVTHEKLNTTPKIQIDLDRKSRKVSRRYVRTWSDRWRSWRLRVMRHIPW